VLPWVELQAPPDPLAIAATLSDLPGLFALVDGVGDGWWAGGRRSFVSADPDRTSDAMDPFESGPRVADPRAARLPRWVGVLPYEACRARLERPSWVGEDRRPPATMTRHCWHRYPAVIAIDHQLGTVAAYGVSDAAALRLARRVEQRLSLTRCEAPRVRARAVEPGEAHVERVRAALELIRAGDLYQASLARRIELELSEPLGGEGLVALAIRLLAASPARFGALLAWPEASVVSTSPELLLAASTDVQHLDDEADRFGALHTEPIKGTRPLCGDPALDAHRERDLDADPKERAELAMVIDVERNDLGRVSVPGSVVVEPPRVVVAGRVLHRLAGVRGAARSDVSREAVLQSIVPSGSVTGAPKIRAMEVIAQLESARRGLYTGGFGTCSLDGSLRLAIAIRTAVFPVGGTVGEWLVGGGIVEASDPDGELAETRWKSRQIATLTGTPEDSQEWM